MSKAVIRHGDPTITGGFVIAGKSTMFDDGKRVALDGDVATCGNCPSTYRIYGTGDGTFENGIHVVVEGDAVFCPCGKNRVLRGANPGMFIETVRESPRTVVPASAPTTPVNPQAYDQHFLLLDEWTGKPLVDTLYRIETDDGQQIEGRTDSTGHTQKVFSSTAVNATVSVILEYEPFKLYRDRQS